MATLERGVGDKRKEGLGMWVKGWPGEGGDKR
jgi:hypothetical protein